jgi:hypothetical protein ELI_2925
MENKKGAIYILTNPSFPEYVKIGYADDLNKRLNSLNSSLAVPFAFRPYAIYDVYHKLDDTKVHNIIDTINPELRSVDNINGRKREFFQMTKEQAYILFESISEISGTKDRLHLIKATEDEIKEEQEANEIREMSINRHHFKDIEFYSSLTNKNYYTKTSEQGTLSIFEKDTDLEVPNNSNPSKKQIVLQALKDLGENIDDGLTLYQLEHRLEKKVLQPKD